VTKTISLRKKVKETTFLLKKTRKESKGREGKEVIKGEIRRISNKYTIRCMRNTET
jgi:hypothetical protein